MVNWVVFSNQVGAFPSPLRCHICLQKCGIACKIEMSMFSIKIIKCALSKTLCFCSRQRLGWYIFRLLDCMDRLLICKVEVWKWEILWEALYRFNRKCDMSLQLRFHKNRLAYSNYMTLYKEKSWIRTFYSKKPHQPKDNNLYFKMNSCDSFVCLTVKKLSLYLTYII